MRILILDDSDTKAARISALASSTLAAHSPAILIANTLQEAQRTLRSTRIDVLVLDVRLPSTWPTGGRRTLDSSACLWLLNAMLTGVVPTPTWVIGITEYEDELPALGELFSHGLWELVQMSPESDGWSLRLSQLLERAQAALMQGAMHDVDACIITALREPELDAVREAFPTLRTSPIPSDPTTYFRGTFSAAGSERTLVAASAPEMGATATAALATKLMLTFRPRIIIMAGIAAGVRATPGAVMVADSAWDWSAGKIASDADNRPIFEPGPQVVRLDPRLRSAFEDFLPHLRESLTLSVPKEYRAKLTPDVRIGPVSTGSMVVSNTEARDFIAMQHRKLLGFEMETYGLYLAAQMAPEPRPLAVSMKTSVDAGDESKSDELQQIGSKLSAIAAASFLRSGIDWLWTDV